MIAYALAAIVYTDVPAQVERVVAYSWQPGRPPVPVESSVTREGSRLSVSLPPVAAAVIVLQRGDDRYLVDGPIAPSGEPMERRVPEGWRRTVGGGVAGGFAGAPPIEWLPATGAATDRWPACWWDATTAWACMGVPVDGAGVVFAADGQRVWSAVVRASGGTLLRASSWGRLLIARDRHGPPADLSVSAARPVVPARRPRSVRVETAALVDVRVTAVDASAMWMAGDSSPPSAWVELRSARSGPEYLALADVAEGSPQVALTVLLDDPRVVEVTVEAGGAVPAGGALVSVFRLIDRPATPGGREPPPRRVFASDVMADAEGRARLEGLGDAIYEIVAWHPRLGRGSLLLPAGAERETIKLQSLGIVRGRVLAGGKAAAGVEVSVVPDPAAAAGAEDPIELMGGGTRTGPDGRFAVTVAPSGGGELRVGGGTYPTKRVPLPRAPLPIVDAGDIELGRAISVSLVLDQDPGCDVRAAGPIGRTGLQIVTAERSAPGLFSIRLPEEGSWEFSLLCGKDERALAPSLVRVTEPMPSAITFVVR